MPKQSAHVREGVYLRRASCFSGRKADIELKLAWHVVNTVVDLTVPVSMTSILAVFLCLVSFHAQDPLEC